jgi:hypothetical protein
MDGFPVLYGLTRDGDDVTTFQAVEALHRIRFPGRELERQAHAARVDAIITAAAQAGIDKQDVSWAERILRSQ